MFARLSIATASLLLAGCAAGMPQAAKTSSTSAAGDLLIADVAVIETASGELLPNRDVLISGDRIVLVAPHGSVGITAEQTVDGAGRYLMPGLFDMHSHTSFAPVHRSSLKLMRANGVTAVREMGSDCADGPGGIAMCIEQMIAARAAIEAGELIGPRLLMLSSAKVDSNQKEDAEGIAATYTPADVTEARKTVAALADRGAELIKVSQEFRPEAFEALMAEAKARDLPVGGHIPMTYSVADVARMGISSIEHARDLPVDCSAYGATYRAAIAAAVRGEGQWPDRSSVPGQARDTFDAEICAEQVQAMAKAGTYYVPTHLTREFDVRAGEEAYVNDERRRYLPEMQLRFWQSDIDRTASMPPEMVADLVEFFDLGLRTTKIAHDAGVQIMVGTDANDTMVFPGFSVHDELRHLVAAGLTEMDVLRAATFVPARYLGRTEDFGGVTEGRIADLLLLDANPLTDIDHSDTIHGVVFDGRYEDRATLDAYLQDVVDFVERANAPSE